MIKIIQIMKLLFRRKNQFSKIVIFVKSYGLWKTLAMIYSKLLRQAIYSYKENFDINNINQTIKGFKKQPLISIIMPVYNVDPQYLAKAIESVKKQFYPNWELCITDDCSINKSTREYLESIEHPAIKIVFQKKNGGISAASNKAVSVASGEYLALLDNDDELTKDALFEVVKCINEHDPGIIYSDEDFITRTGKSFSAHFKPDFSPDLLLSHNYITHLLVMKKKLFEIVKGFSTKYDGAQDYDLVLKLTEKSGRIHHITKILYHWRMLESSTSYNPASKNYAHEAGQQALAAAVARRKIKAEILPGKLMFYYHVQRKISRKELISIIIPFKDKSELLITCIESVLDKSSYHAYEIIGINNNSREEETFHIMRELEARDKRIRFHSYNYPFNFAAINNFGVSKAKGEHYLFLNNDIEIINNDWLEALLEHSQRKEIGAVGGKLYFPNNSIQHAGVILGINGFAGHSHKGMPAEANGYFGRLNCIQNISAVTGAMLMVKKQLFQKVQGFDEAFAVAFNDIDFCLRLRQKGYLNLFTPYSQAIHYESLSRGSDKNKANKDRFEHEKALFIKRHKEILAKGDPYYNPQLSLRTEKFYYGNNEK